MSEQTTQRRRLVHLGIGAFARAHTLLYTQQAGGWEAVVFTGRSPEIARTLEAQEGRYGLVVRGPESDDVELIDVIAAAHPADDLAALEQVVADAETHVVTLTITEKGYSAGNDPATSVPARLARALRARREAGIQEPIALVSCDNLSGNGEILRESVLAAIDAAGDAQTREWFADHVDVPTTMVDRITPGAGEAERELASERLGFEDAATVVTEPFHEWIIEDAFRGQRPAWEDAGAQLVPDVAIHEQRKLRLLNGAHSFLAYAGQVAGFERVDQAIGDPRLRGQVQELWAEARRTIDLPDQELEEYTAALVERFANPRLSDALRRIAADGSVKLGVRIVPVIAQLGIENAPAGIQALAGWCRWVTDEVRAGREVPDPRGEDIARAAAIPEDAERVGALLSLIGGGLIGTEIDADALTAAVLAAG